MATEARDFEIVSTTHTPALQKMLAKPDATANPFKIVIDPKVRLDLRRALIDLIIITTKPWRNISPKANLRSIPTRNTSNCLPAV